MALSPLKLLLSNSVLEFPATTPNNFTLHLQLSVLIPHKELKSSPMLIYISYYDF
jgi:hypothetical protein